MVERNPCYILGIETSCDDTSASVVSDGYKVHSNVVGSQTEVHSLYGGVVPEIASREHLKLLSPLVKKAVTEAGITFNDLSGIAVTKGPGLVGPLLVGVSFAKSFAYAKELPLIPVNHIKAHIFANFLSSSTNKGIYQHDFPLIALVISGGHTSIYYMKSYETCELIGSTRDDACGEAFDKIARALDLGYPGGPLIESEAFKGEPSIDFTKPKIDSKYDFSFSGLKSSVLNYLNKKKMKDEKFSVPDVCSSLQSTVAEILVDKTIKAALDTNVKTILLAGGVSANRTIRTQFTNEASKHDIKLCFPKLNYCTDNAAMVASLGYFNYKLGLTGTLDMNAVPNLTP
ncbi:tRNA (adenosine(37)-N6)-threonylcarbamoyltransferase complex transferase subunit TsaD [Natranaerobius trueperi]|uniref:tRNA N6-adenosine threonylcarbamoyltransferase n=1 Tax=Natranaerobius trueperi TaxID=759412 RepID=A0A226C0H2_9FIRM|nr:tRNA (adenosine(37)-N6)-threonylcarbamoyltransferase complex transferase subunit TsaD [Natranaerobius trueperi]OWZ84798.1 tRNA (adenosine(37)-N6)-threonylcarbamoyltransferase complex transferase subunit TsaD [Natranaerobius trueperi]